MIDPQRGEVWRVQLDPTRGSEQTKTRPCVVLNSAGVGRRSMRICVPIVGWQHVQTALFWCSKIDPTPDNGLMKESSADASQIRSLDVERFEKKLGTLDRDDVETIAAAVALCVGYAPSTS